MQLNSSGFVILLTEVTVLTRSDTYSLHTVHVALLIYRYTVKYAECTPTVWSGVNVYYVSTTGTVHEIFIDHICTYKEVPAECTA